MIMPASAPFTDRSPSVRRSAAAVLGAALLLPLGACGYNTFSERAQVTEILDASAAQNYHTLIVDTSVGDIVVTGDESASGITAEITKIGKGRTPEAAQESLDRIRIVFAPVADEPGVFVCTSEFPKKWAGHAHQVEWNIRAPSHLALDLISDVGDLTASRFNGGVSARSDVGDIELAQIMGGVDVRSDVGDVEVEAGGPIIAVSDVGDVDIVVIDTGYGSLGSVNLRSDVGDITLKLPAHAMGLVNASTSTGDVEIEFDDAAAYSIIRKSRTGKSLRAELNGSAEPSIEMHADVGDVELEFYGPERTGG